MKRLDEKHIEKIIKKVIKEDMFDNNLEYDIKELIRNSNASNEESISILRNIADEMESSRRVRRGAVSRFRDEM
jgi:Leu/Phe-tRNA-protein transferase